MNVEPSALHSDTETEITGPGFGAEICLSPLNQRIQVLRYEADDRTALVAHLERVARDRGFGKVFLKAPVDDRASFESAGMDAEAIIDGYFSGHPAAVMSLFVDDTRRHSPTALEEAEILKTIRKRPADGSVPTPPEGYEMSLAEPADARELAGLYNEVFASYPFPIHDPEYLTSTMESHVTYRVVRDHTGAVVGAASAETNRDLRNAEMTDFATRPNQRGRGLAQHLLAALEEDMSETGIDNLYTIARARSAGMNRVFYNRGYQWTGTLVNNCHIAGRFEDMHVWCKGLAG